VGNPRGAAGAYNCGMLPPTLAETKAVYQGPRFKVHTAWLPGREGGKVQRDAVVAPDAVVILPILEKRQVVMIRNERFIAGQTLWELPAGTLEAGEDPAAGAARELMEETGYRAGEIAALTQFYPSPGICTEYMNAFVARDLEPVGQKLDESERIEVEVVTWRKVLAMMRDGTIRDGKTVAALLFYRTFAGR